MVKPKTRSGALQNYTSSKGSDGSIYLTIQGPQTLVVEINGDLGTPILIFANKIDTTPSNCTYYYSPGNIYNNINLTLKSNETVYVAPGAIINGNFRTEIGATNVQIKGMGIITGDNINRSLIELRNASNSSIGGVILVQSKKWTVPIYGGSKITIDDIKIVTNNNTSDGIDVVGSNNVTISNCFILTKDDCIAIKTGVNYNWDDPERANIDVKKPVHTIKVQNCILLNGIDGNALEIGCELNENVSNITYENIDIVHPQCPCNQDEGALSINNQGNYTVSGVLYKNIWIDEVQRYFINLKVEQSNYYSPGGSLYQYSDYTYSPGIVKNITYENIYVTKTYALHSAIRSISANNRIQNIEFKNFYINNNKINSYVDYNTTDIYSNKFVIAIDNSSKGQIYFK